MRMVLAPGVSEEVLSLSTAGQVPTSHFWSYICDQIHKEFDRRIFVWDNCEVGATPKVSSDVNGKVLVSSRRRRYPIDRICQVGETSLVGYHRFLSEIDTGVFEAQVPKIMTKPIALCPVREGIIAQASVLLLENVKVATVKPLEVDLKTSSCVVKPNLLFWWVLFGRRIKRIL